MDVTSSSYGIDREAVGGGIAQFGSGNPAASLVIEDLDEFSVGVYATCGTWADYVSGTQSAAAYN
jgi:hypothetical protein